jgi:hypothetical protein
MSKAILEFNLPEDQPEFNNAIKGGDWKHVCWEMDQYLRRNTKYASDDTNEEALQALKNAREFLNNLMVDNNVDLYEVE